VGSTVGVRELRQNLSIYLDQVKRGVVLQVTEHGHVVATLQPAAAAVTRLERLEALGLATRARKEIRDLPARRPLPAGAASVSAILDELGADRL
jgi:prevent-host-death family protein